MSDLQRPPWWLSDEDPEPSSARSDPGSPSDAPWQSLLGSLGSLGSLSSLGSLAGELWAASGAAGHSEHGDPRDNPGCVVCKAMTALSVSLAEPESKELPAVRWIPIRRL